MSIPILPAEDPRYCVLEGLQRLRAVLAQPDAPVEHLALAWAPLLAQFRQQEWTGLLYLGTALDKAWADPRVRQRGLSAADTRQLQQWCDLLEGYVLGEGDGRGLLDALRGASYWPELPARLAALMAERLAAPQSWRQPPRLPDPPVPSATGSDHDPQPAPAVSGADRTADAGLQWVSADEQGVLAETLAERVLDPAAHLAAAATLEEALEAVALLDDELQLLGNAFTAMELPALAREMERVRRNLDTLQRSRAEPAPELLAAPLEWALALQSWVQAPSAEAAHELMQQCTADVWPIPDFEPSALLGELRRVRIGLDPQAAVAPLTPLPASEWSLQLATDVAPAVRDGMLRELPGHVLQLQRAIDLLLRAPDEPQAALESAFRHAHTLKGDAHIVGARGLAHLAHALEDILVDIRRTPTLLHDAELGEVLQEAVDLIAAMADHLLQQGPPPEGVGEVLERVRGWAHHLQHGRQEVASTPAATPAAAVPPTPAPHPEEAASAGAWGSALDAIPIAPAAAAAAETETESVPVMSVPVPVLDRLLDLCGETVVLNRQLERQLRVLRQQQQEFAAGSQRFERLSQQLDDLVSVRGSALESRAVMEGRELDPLELDQYDELHTVARRIQEAGSDQREFRVQGGRTLNDALDLLHRLEQLQEELQRQVLGTRRVALRTVVPRLERVVRQTARSLGRPSELVVDGADVTIDADILDRLLEPLLHILRNAVDHGIESVAERRAAGKPDSGTIRLWAQTEGVHVRLVVEDDGQGLDRAAIRRKAEALGWLQPGQVVDDDVLFALLLRSGFSTRSEVSATSGRGVGLDVVASRVRTLKGTLQLASNAGQGTRLDLRLPADLNTAQVLVARLPHDTLALTTDRIEQLVLVEAAQLDPSTGRPRFRHQGHWIPAVELEAVCFGGDVLRIPARPRHVGLLVRSTDGTLVGVLCAVVDEARSVVVNRLGPNVPPLPAVRGVTVLGDGRVAPVVDLPELLDQRIRDAGSAPTPVADPRPVPRVLVADDSLSVRRALAELLGDAGYAVDTARDGLEALGALHRSAPDAVVLDLEMPGLNGLELTRFIRSLPQFAELPILMITSRGSAGRHQALASEAGVDLILGKPYAEDQVLEFLVQRVRG